MEVWAYSPDKSVVPPSSQWRAGPSDSPMLSVFQQHTVLQVPYDGPIDPTFNVQAVGSQESPESQLLLRLSRFSLPAQEQQAYQQPLECNRAQLIP